MPYNITRDELNHMVKKILGSFTKIKNLEKEKDLNNLLKKKNKGSSTGKRIECFNCGGWDILLLIVLVPKILEPWIRITCFYFN